MSVITIGSSMEVLPSQTTVTTERGSFQYPEDAAVSNSSSFHYTRSISVVSSTTSFSHAEQLNGDDATAPIDSTLGSQQPMDMLGYYLDSPPRSQDSTVYSTVIREDDQYLAAASQSSHDLYTPDHSQPAQPQMVSYIVQEKRLQYHYPVTPPRSHERDSTTEGSSQQDPRPFPMSPPYTPGSRTASTEHPSGSRGSSSRSSRNAQTHRRRPSDRLKHWSGTPLSTEQINLGYFPRVEDGELSQSLEQMTDI